MFLTTKPHTSMLINFQCLVNLENSRLNLLIRPQYMWNGKHPQTRRKTASFVATKYITSKSTRGKSLLDRHLYSTCLVYLFSFLQFIFSIPPVLPDANIFQKKSMPFSRRPTMRTTHICHKNIYNRPKIDFLLLYLEIE